MYLDAEVVAQRHSRSSAAQVCSPANAFLAACGPLRLADASAFTPGPMRGCGLVRSDADAGRLTALGETIVAGSGSEPVLVVADLRTAGSRR